jgi:two-component system invasion response regulator UvrY
MSAPTPLRLLVVDDHPLIRLGLRQILADVDDIAISAEATSGIEGVRCLESTPLDLVTLDMAMPGRSGVEILRRMRAVAARVPVLIYSRFPEEQYALRALRAGAAGYLMKSAPPSEVVNALRRVGRGERYLSPRMSRQVTDCPQHASDHDRLSNREFEILRLLASGHTVSRIAADLSLSIKTVSTHRTRLLKKLGLTSTADLVHYAIEQGLDDTQT